MNSGAAPETNHVSRLNFPVTKTFHANRQTGAESSHQQTSDFKVQHLIEL